MNWVLSLLLTTISACHVFSQVCENTPTFQLNDLPGTVLQARAVFAIDVDGDLDIDLLSAGNDGEVAWHENNGNQSFTKRVMPTNLEKAQTVFAIDVNKDTHIDIISASSENGKIVWYENDGNEVFTERTVGTGTDIQKVFAIDLDQDGEMDILTAERGFTRIRWFKNNGSEVFTVYNVSTNFDAADVFATDVDKDGIIDVIASSQDDDRIAWYKFDGTTGFTANILPFTVNNALGVYAIDIDGDTEVDLLSAARDGNEVAWYKNNGSEVFSKQSISTTATAASDVFATDLDGDGDVDVLAALRTANTVVWYENTGSGNFAAPRTVSNQTGNVREVYAFDVDRDGFMDVLSASNLDAKVSWHKNICTITPPPSCAAILSGGATICDCGATDLSVTITGSPGPYEVAIDSSGDATADITISNYMSGDPIPVSLRKTTTFTLLSVTDNGSNSICSVSGSVIVRVNNVHPGRIGNDQFLPSGDDPAAFSSEIDGSGSGTISYRWFRSERNCSGGFSELANTNSATYDNGIVNTSSYFRRITVSNLGGLICEASSNCASVIVDEVLPQTCPNPATFTPFDIDLTLIEARSVFAIDVNRDGLTDVVASGNQGELAWYDNNGDGTFTKNFIATNLGGSQTVFAIDLNIDGFMDFIAHSSSLNRVIWYENNGNQSFTTNIIPIEASGVQQISAIDVDGDLDVDIVFVEDKGNGLIWFENDGNQNFTFRRISIGIPDTNALSTVDLDGDSDIDIVVSEQDNNILIWYENIGCGDFRGHQISTTLNNPQSVFSIDVNADGFMDIILGERTGNKVSWYQNDGNQNFSENIISSGSVADGVSSVFATDLDGDGDLDVMAALRDLNQVVWYENNGSQVFARRVISSDALNVRSVFAADIDGNGVQDILSASNIDDKIAWYKNECLQAVPVPVELLSFSADLIKQNEIHLIWETASEVNNDYFILERSIDGNVFESIAKINGAGTTNIPQAYSFNDSKPFSGNNFYRLKQVDFDGQFQYHSVVVVHVPVAKLRMFPSLVKEEINVYLAGKSLIRIFDSFGVLKKEISMRDQAIISVSDLPNGTYYLSSQSGSRLETKAFVKY